MCVRPARLQQKREVGLTVPCGQCIECRLKRSRDWAMRCMHEASLFEDNSFVTLTYADEFLPKGGSLDGPVPSRSGLPGKRGAFPLFMDRLRKAFGPVRYFHAGEYGEKNGRPHYHALLFGLRFYDQSTCGESASGHSVFQSDSLSRLWPFGLSQLGAVTFESAQYVARYCIKKVTGQRAAAHYQRVDAQGVIHQLEPEYATMSRRPGIGFGWYQKFREEVYRDDTVLRAGKEMSPPRFYDKKEAELDEARMEVVKARRIRKHGARCTVANGYTWRTNAAREQIAVANLKRLEEARR